MPRLNCPTFKTETKSALDSVLLKEPRKAPNVLQHGSIEHFIPWLPVSSRLVLVGHYQLYNELEFQVATLP